MAEQAPAIFISDAPGLDFLNSIATPVDTPTDWIRDGAGLLDWLAQAGLVPPETRLALQAHTPPGELDQVAAQARDLREWFRGFVQARMGRSLSPADLADLHPLNRLLERDDAFTRIVAQPEPGAGPLQLQPVRRWRTADTLLLPIGETLAQLVCTEDFADVKACEGPVCTLLFADHTRGHARRWCSMAACGNRAKQAAHRSRAKAARG